MPGAKPSDYLAVILCVVVITLRFPGIFIDTWKTSRVRCLFCRIP